MSPFSFLSLGLFTRLKNLHSVSPSPSLPSSTSIPQASPLLTLPPEILIMIIQPLLVSPLTVPLHRHWDSYDSYSWNPYHDFFLSELHTHRLSTGVLFTCRHLYALGCSVYYQDNHFAVSIRSLQQFVSCFPQQTLSKIRSLEIRCSERFADWPLWPLLAALSGLERVIFDPSAIQQWNWVSGMTHLRGVAPLAVRRAGYRSLGDVVWNSDPSAMAAVSPKEEAAARDARTEVVLRCMPRLTGFWIIRRYPSLIYSRQSSNSESGVVRERNHREVEMAVKGLIHRREREKGGECKCEHTAQEEFCCQKRPLRAWEWEGKYAPMEAEMRRWQLPEPKSWDRTSSFGNPSYESFLDDEEHVWGKENSRIMRRLHEACQPS